MTEFKQHAQNLIAKKDFIALEKFLSQPPDGCEQLAAELTLYSLVEQGRSFEQLEAPFDQYLDKYLDSMPVSNLEMAAQLKFRLKKFEDAVKYSGMVLDKKDDIEIAEIAAISLFNLEKNKMGSKLVDQLIATKPADTRYYEWYILFNFKLAEYQKVIEGWEILNQRAFELTQTNSVLVFVVRSFIYRGQLSKALEILDQYQLESQRDDIEVGLMLAEVNKASENYEEAEKILRNLVVRYPDLPEARWNLSLILLSQAKLKEGWDFYESRWSWSQFPSTPRSFDCPKWDGFSDLDGRRLLIWGEQGIGDQLRFLTLLPNLLDKYPSHLITLECDAKIVTLVKMWFPELEVQAFGLNDTRGTQQYSQFDAHYPSGSLPRIFLPQISDKCNLKFRRLKVSQEKKDELLGSFMSSKKMLVGISWRSMLMMKTRVDDYFDVTAFAQMIDEAPIDIGFVSLQYDISERERRILSRFTNVFIPDRDFLNDVHENAFYAGSVDVLFSVGTVVATCAGIFGVPVVSWSRFDDPVNLGQAANPWFPNRLDFKTKPNWDKTTLLTRLSRVLNSYYEKACARECKKSDLRA